MAFKFKRKRHLLSEKNNAYKTVGYARVIEGEFEYLENQIKSLENEGCNLIFSEVISLDAEVKPQLNKAISSLSKGDELIVTKLDRAFLNKKECLKIINKLINEDIKLRTLSGFLASNDISIENSSIYKILYELDNLENDSSIERKKELISRRRISGNNLGGRPKISPLKESLVMRLRREGNSYRSIRTQTGVALSTIRRIILDKEET